MEGRSRVLCKFFLHGACLKGDDCMFSHNWSDQASQVCTFYQRGLCTYGAHCRYEHVKVSRVTNLTPPAVPVVRHLPAVTPLAANGDSVLSGVTVRTPSIVPLKDAWQHNSSPSLTKRFAEISLGQTEAEESEPVSDDPRDRPICAFAATGNCPLGESCRNVHGDLCPTCGKHCLHPYRPSERENHMLQCQRNKKNLEALLKSQDIECCVCLERIHSKPTAAERKFGLMSGCDHPFCVGCIRGWRSGSHAPGMDIDTVVRACPVCRVPTHYVVPSVVWYFSPDEKEEIINGYKNKLGERDCRYFDFGNGTCPFGSSCFYKHAFKDGTLEEVKLRHLGAADGSTVIVKNVSIIAKRQAGCVLGFLEPGLRIISGILLHNAGRCLSITLLVVASILAVYHLEHLECCVWEVKFYRDFVEKYSKRKGRTGPTSSPITPELGQQASISTTWKSMENWSE